MDGNRTLRFSSTVKREIRGSGVAVDLVLEVVVPADYPVHMARLDLVESEGGRVGVRLEPEPKNARILTVSATQVEITKPATPTVVIDMDAEIELERSEESVMEKAGDIITPEIADPPSLRRMLLAGVCDRPMALV